MKDTKPKGRGIDIALAAVGGRPAVLARILGVSKQAVYTWKNSSSGNVPPKRAKELESLFKIPRKDLNPDVFG